METFNEIFIKREQMLCFPSWLNIGLVWEAYCKDEKSYLTAAQPPSGVCVLSSFNSV